ncbi:hypothetical protein BDW42DRAFT_189646 [Aspergillus taichungensis]|uniref:Uncharacterized protein n=1 Tax=Aspergillus taichungensis TaxID=482145 RepID=A0A2J5HD56_9EURO|nr:hypothetical protein BDW42DRAFT_189646 [Aspergillus taichungensis]
MGRLFESLFSRRSDATSTGIGGPLLHLGERSDGVVPHQLLGPSSSREAVERSMVWGSQNGAPDDGKIDFDRSARHLHPPSSARHRESPRNGPPSTESTRPPRSIRRLTGWVSHLRSRHARDKAAWDACPVPDQSAYHAPITSRDRAEEHLVPCASFLSEDPSSRKPSERTTVSDLTAVTVSHHPSQRTLTPIPTVDRDLIFEDTSRESTRLDEPQAVATVAQTNPGFVCADVPFDFFPDSAERDADEITLPACHCGSSSTNQSHLPRSVSNESRWSAGLDRQAAAIAFNELAGQFQFAPLPVPPDGQDAEVDRTDETVPRRRDRVLVRIRSMRSSLSLGSPVSPPRTLRRRRTVVGVRCIASAMTSLSGKPLDSLARLGGHSFLFLPSEFAPAPLRLPVCFVATAAYLRRFGRWLILLLAGPHVHDLFLEMGDQKTAIRVYEYFARQVLSAEREQDRIQETTRRSQMPVELVEVLRPDGTSDHASQVQGVAWAFKALVAGLPGGLLGSSRLYETLVDLSQHRHSSGVGRSSARVQGIGLAILALTSPLQRNLLCGVMGLCSSLVAGRSETEGAIRHRLDSLIQAWEPVLRGRTGRTADAFSAVEREIEGQRVVGMLIDNWRRVSRQLCSQSS